MLHFDLEPIGFERLQRELGASDRQVRLAFNRALNRTVSRLRMLSSKGLQSELGLRRAAAMRRRLKSIRVRGAGGMTEARLWYGLNNLPVSEFKGRARRTPQGASFQGGPVRGDFSGAFVAKPGGAGRRSIFRRVKAVRLPISEETLAIKDKADTFVEDQVFDQLEDILWREFRRDLEARTIYSVGG